jgi:peptidyl-prolyl cis-trans isomerase C
MTPKSIHLTALAFLVAIAAATPVVAADKGAAADKAVATVNNSVIPQARLDLNVKAAVQQGQTDSPELRQQIKDDLIDLELVAQEARKKGLDKQPEVVQMLEITRQKVLSNAFAQDFIEKNPIKEDKLKEVYEHQKKTVVGKQEYKVAHILVASEKEAQAIVASLNKKGDFAKIAKEKSKDRSSKAQGGELGWTNPSSFVAPLAEALVKLNKGQISAPVKTEFGWHILKLEDVRDFVVPSYEKVKDELEKRMQQMALKETLKTLRAQAKIN